MATQVLCNVYQPSSLTFKEEQVMWINYILGSFLPEYFRRLQVTAKKNSSDLDAN